MLPITSRPSPNSGLNLVLVSIPQTLLLEIGTASILLFLTTEKVTIAALESIGKASEELLRGDRLPILPFPNHDELTNKS